MKKEIKITDEEAERAIFQLSRPDIFFDNFFPESRDFSKLVAKEMEKQKVEYPSDLVKIIFDLCRSINSKPAGETPMGNIKGAKLNLFVLPNFIEMCESVLPKEFSKKLVTLIADGIRPKRCLNNRKPRLN